jgi:hypothetical protein
MTDFTFNQNIDLSVLDEFFESVERAQGIVAYQAPYALYVEVDTSYDRGLKPPLQPLLEWTQRNITADINEARPIAYAIQEKIFQEGIKGEYYLITTKKEWETKWESVVENYNDADPTAPEQIVEDILAGILEDSNDKLNRAGKNDTGNLIDSGIVLMGADPENRNVEEIDPSGFV